jgi:5-methylcytosine-specific restriction protein A
MVERDASIRKKALEHYGAKCMGCEFLPKTSNQLDVHHKDPIADGVRKTKITDLAVLCANCHRLAHSRKPPLTIEEIRLNSI